MKVKDCLLKTILHKKKNKLASLQNYNDDEVRELISALNLRLTTLEGDYEALEAKVAALETPAA